MANTCLLENEKNEIQRLAKAHVMKVFFSRKMPEDSLETFTSKPHFENFRIINIQCHFVASATLFFETPHL